jgi:hypothetical protein
MKALIILLVIAVIITVVKRLGRKKYVRYNHHGCQVWVRKDLKGRHREHCLCFSCALFCPEDRNRNCPVANKLFEACVVHNVVTPVWECPEFAKLPS